MPLDENAMSLVDGEAKLQTFSARYFSLDNPKPEDVELFDIAHALGNLCRFAGHSANFYSVAQHSILVSQLVNYGELGPADRKWARFVGLFHDAAEAYTGDFIRDLKIRLRGAHGDADDGLDAIEERVHLAVRTRFRVPTLSADLAAEVKTADLRALATEKRDLMGNGPGPWRLLDNYAPDERVISPMDPEESSLAFLKHYIEVRP